MRVVNIRDAKTNLSRLVREAAAGKPFIIAKAGKPLVRVIPLSDSSEAAVDRMGFLAGQIEVPEDFDRMAETEVAKLFGGEC